MGAGSFIQNIFDYAAAQVKVRKPEGVQVNIIVIITRLLEQASTALAGRTPPVVPKGVLPMIRSARGSAPPPALVRFKIIMWLRSVGSDRTTNQGCCCPARERRPTCWQFLKIMSLDQFKTDGRVV